jgi:filamentous hemagglutinin
MAIIQISKIQQRTGNLVDLPQLDEAEFGWATDTKRLFIGKSVPNENIEVLTSYSNISFSQITGSFGGNLNIDTPQNGQFLTYVSSTATWQNSGGNSLQPGNSALYTTNDIHLGNVGNVKLGGGAIGYVLQTDGTGNLTWSSKGTITANIIALSNATPIVMRVATSIPYTNGTSVTISGVNGAANSNVNSKIFYVKVANDFPTSGNVSLYTDSTLVTAAVGTSLTYTNSPNALAITSVGGGGAAAANGSTYSVQFNNSGILSGDSNITWDFNNRIFSVNGNANITGNLNVTANVAGSRLVSNVAVGTAPIVVTSTTRVANLSVAYANVSDFGVTTTQTTGTFYPVFVSGNTTANYALSSNANISIDAATGLFKSTLLSATGTITGGNIATAGTLSAGGNANVGNLGTGGLITATGNLNAGNIITAGIMSSTGNAVHGNISTAGVLSVTGNANVGNLGTGGLITATGNLNAGNIITAGIMSSTGNATHGNISTGGVLSVTGNANIGNIGTAGLITATGNLNAGNIGTAGILTVTGNANVGNLGTTGVYSSTLSASGNANVGNLGTAGLITATGNLNAGNLITGGVLSVTGNANVGNLGTGGLVTVTGNLNAGNIITAGIMSSTGNATHGNITTGGIISATGTITGGNLTTTGNASLGNLITTVITTGANITAGTITGNWSLSAGSRLQSTYADLAEYYEADVLYEPGTVLAFGGDKEVTIAEDGTTRVAGVVSTNPAYAMNQCCKGFAVAIALQGRVPCKVRGTVRKGDMMVSGGNGFARPWNNPQMGMVIGKALEDFDGIEGVIEVAVGRL